MDIKQLFTEYAVKYGLRIIAAVLILFVGFKLVNVLTNAIRKKKKLHLRDETTYKFLLNILSISLKIVVFIITASVVGIPSASLVALLGSVGVAVGLALQGGLSNLAGGVMLVFFRPYAIGDYIVVDGQDGTVTDIGIFYTTLLSMENRKIVIPNSLIIGNSVKNCTCEEDLRILLDITASYDAKIPEVKKILEEVAAAEPLVLKEKPVDILVMEHSESSIKYSFRCWCKMSDFWECRSRLLESVKRRFDEEGIEIPYNKLDVNILNK